MTTDHAADHAGGMEQATSTLRPDHQVTDGPRLVPAAALLAALGSLAYISTVAAGGDLSAREAFLLPVGVVGCVLSTVGCLGLALRLPVEITAPRWAVWSTAAALAFVMAQAWATATVVVGLAGQVDDVTFDAVGSSWGLTVFMLPKIPLGVVGLMGLAVVAWRVGPSRGAAGLLALASLAFLLPPFPPGLLLACLGLIWTSRAKSH